MYNVSEALFIDSVGATRMILENNLGIYHGLNDSYVCRLPGPVISFMKYYDDIRVDWEILTGNPKDVDREMIISCELPVQKINEMVSKGERARALYVVKALTLSNKVSESFGYLDCGEISSCHDNICVTKPTSYLICYSSNNGKECRLNFDKILEDVMRSSCLPLADFSASETVRQCHTQKLSSNIRHKFNDDIASLVFESSIPKIAVSTEIVGDLVLAKINVLVPRDVAADFINKITRGRSLGSDSLYEDFKNICDALDSSKKEDPIFQPINFSMPLASASLRFVTSAWRVLNTALLAPIGAVVLFIGCGEFIHFLIRKLQLVRNGANRSI